MSCCVRARTSNRLSSRRETGESMNFSRPRGGADRACGYWSSSLTAASQPVAADSPLRGPRLNRSIGVRLFAIYIQGGIHHGLWQR